MMLALAHSVAAKEIVEEVLDALHGFSIVSLRVRYHDGHHPSCLVEVALQHDSHDEQLGATERLMDLHMRRYNEVALDFTFVSPDMIPNHETLPTDETLLAWP
jgi:hypothetical protein